MDDYRTFQAPSKRTVTVGVGKQYEPSVYLNIEGPDNMDAFGWVPKADVPALALAILEAAGYSLESDYSMGSAVRELKDHLHAQSVLAEREQLKSEAKALYTAAYGSDTGFLSTSAQEFWGAVAKKARELHKGEAK